MAFVNEEVSEEDKKNPLFQRYSPVPPRDMKIHPYWWTIDRERDFIFKSHANATREEPACLVYQWKGEFGALLARESWVKIDAPEHESGFRYKYIWTIEELHIPVVCAQHQDEIRNILTEAFEVYVDNYGRYYGNMAPPIAEVNWDRCSFIVGGSQYVRI